MAAERYVAMCLIEVVNASVNVVSTNISRIILSQTINSLNLREYAKNYGYEEKLLIACIVHDAYIDRM